jgi:prevent-host-death family protein
MESRISATEAARSFSDLLNRVRHRGEQYVVEHGGEPICRIVPAGPTRFTLADLAQLMETAPKPDAGYERGSQESDLQPKPLVTLPR